MATLDTVEIITVLLFSTIAILSMVSIIHEAITLVKNNI